MSRCHVRCRGCWARRVLSKHPDKMVRLPQCSSCGSRSWRADKWMNERRTGPMHMGCRCDGYWFTHRRGSLFCWYRPDRTERTPSDADFRDRHMDAPPLPKCYRFAT